MGVFDVREGERRRESPAGIHYYGLYRECPRKWYLKYPMGLRPLHTAPALLMGGAMHEALAVYYENFNLQRAQKVFREALSDRKPEYADGTKFTEDFNRGPRMLEEFHEKVGKVDALDYDVIEVEHEYQIPFGPDNFLFTIRPDRVLQKKLNRLYYPVETKTSSYSLTSAGVTADRSDQVTGYLWALSRVHPDWNIGGCLIDIIYNKKSVFDAARMGTPAYRNKHELIMFEMGLYGTVVELTQKYKSLEHYPWPLLFPQHRAACSHWGCEYLGICFTNLQPDEVPPGFIKDDWKSDMSSAFAKTQSFSLDDITYNQKEVSDVT